ncbi:hypothetical protein [Kutzneria buriramensis]|uniref:Butirosin biosynthesis protein H-like n=1 Tax=Kutzneria buriramensis TaxID=1045776 RepID=A0A3E0H0H9_9PSEU|nr:hypothetical protein [Kutzneria buriramensis]REH36377.1 hypothetical protein BCF44_116247 [Kutzneria buriramensis]
MRPDTEVAKSAIVERLPPEAVNCLSGSFVRLADLHGRCLDEASIMELGEGYLLRAGPDERSCPEIVFGVEEVVHRGLTAQGCEVRTDAIDPGDWAGQLRTLLADHLGVVVWVNSSHLPYADVYTAHPRFMHALVALELSADLRWVKVFDSLVDDRVRFACVSWLPSAAFEAAILDRIPSKSLDHMGSFHVLERVREPLDDDNAAARSLVSQARKFRRIPEFHNVVNEYRSLCGAAFAGSRDTAKHAARRLFDNVNVLCVIPVLRLLDRSLVRAGAGDALLGQCRALAEDWHVLGLQGLKFEATLSASLAQRIDERFERLDGATAHFWETVSTELADD